MKIAKTYSEIISLIDEIDPIAYAKTRNYVDGAVSYLSPYISRGVISTKFVFLRLLRKGFKPYQMEKFVQELAWRDYWQSIWKEKEDIDDNKYQPGQKQDIPLALVKQQTGIDVIDLQINELVKTGYMHNHVRMYLASMVCNIGNYNWYDPAKWMYYHLLDGDWASNALSWQWVAGVNRDKKYFANQENVNKYTKTSQKDSYLDVSYEDIPDVEIPIELLQSVSWQGTTIFPKNKPLHLAQKPTLIYNYYNLDPLWRKDEDVNRILLLEPSTFNKYPISQNCLEFCLYWAEQIEGLQVVVMEYDQLYKNAEVKEFIAKEHPLNNYKYCITDSRDWLVTDKYVEGSFFKYWKQISPKLGFNSK